MTFKIGDRVQLKSGGPLMTVTAAGGFRGEPRFTCTWFDKQDNENSSVYPPDALEICREARRSAPVAGSG